MPQRRVVELQFPLAGIERRFAYQSQPPYTTPDALNVRPWDPILRRERGGSRVGVERHIRSRFCTGVAAPLRALDVLRFALPDGLTIFRDDFAQGLSTDWSVQFGSDLPTVTDGVAECADGDTVTAVHTAMDFTYSGAVPDAGLTVEALILPHQGKYQGTYRLFLYLDDTSPDKAQNCFELELSTTARSTLNGSPVKDNGTSTVTVHDQIFQSWMVGRNLVVSGGGTYPIVSVTSTTICVVTGDASGEADATATTVESDGTNLAGYVRCLDAASVTWREDFTWSPTVVDAGWLRLSHLPKYHGTHAGYLAVTFRGHTLKYITNAKVPPIVNNNGHRWGFEMVSSQGGTGKIERVAFHYGYQGGTQTSRYVMVGVAKGQVRMERAHYETEASLVEQCTGINPDVFCATASVADHVYIADHGGAQAHETEEGAWGTPANYIADVYSPEAGSFVELRWSRDRAAWVHWVDDVLLGGDPTDFGVFVYDGPSWLPSGSYRAQGLTASNKLQLRATMDAAHGVASCKFFLARTAKLANWLPPDLADDRPRGRLRLTPWGGSSYADPYPLYLPIGFSIVARYCDRMIVSGDPLAPYIVYMSRVNSEDDWDYSQMDSEAAVAISLLGFGNLEVTAVIPFADDYLLIGCRTSLWVQRGDPKYQGTLQNLSRNVGVVGPEAWAWLPDGRLVFLSHMGLYELQPGASSYPRPLSPDRLPSELKGVNKDTHRAVLAYDPVEEGVLITVSPIDYAASTVTHWWFDPRREAFWRDELPRDIDPVCPLRGAFQKLDPPGLPYGGRDGYVYHRALHRISDADTAIAANVIYGPLRLGRSPVHDGILQELEAQLGADSDAVTWAVQVAATAQAAVSAAALASGGFNGGDNYTARPRARGRAACVKLSSTASARWAIEALAAIVGTAGRHRKS